MYQQLLTMLELQNSMNSKVHPDWRAQNFAWYRAIWIECAELMDHHGWKWWKKQEVDRNQVMLELVDIWHFGLSDLLQKGASVEAVAQKLSANMAIVPAPGEFLAEVETFAAQVLTRRAFDVDGFTNLMAAMDLSFEELYKSYIGKNMLNLFRQENGYKAGTYLKVWQAREDNEHLVDVLNELNIASPDFQEEVYQGLARRYRAVTEDQATA